MSGKALSEGVAGLAFRHWAHGPLGPIEDREQVRGDGRELSHKPNGLWLSVEGNDDGWREWCEAEDFRTGWTHVYDVELAEGANVLWLRSALDIDVFTQRFRWRDGPSYMLDGSAIRWRDVADEWDGIVIAPYQWSRRLDGGAGWYYSWDCASGCIWRAHAIQSVRQIPTPTYAPTDSEVQP